MARKMSERIFEGGERKPPAWATLRQPYCRFSIETFGVCDQSLKESKSWRTEYAPWQLRRPESVRPAQGN